MEALGMIEPRGWSPPLKLRCMSDGQCGADRQEFVARSGDGHRAGTWPVKAATMRGPAPARRELVSVQYSHPHEEVEKALPPAA